MLNFLKRVLGSRNDEIADPDDTPEEFWKTDFRKRSRFQPERGESYAAEISPTGLSLSIHKKNVYVWTVNPIYRYKDFALESLITFPNATTAPKKKATATGFPQAGTMAAGILARYLSDSTFYAILLSDEGLVRIDAVVNGTPVPILGWTETGEGDAPQDVDGDKAPYETDPNVYSLRVIAQGTTLTIIVNDRWVASCQDDTIQAAGRIAFAAQNWSEREKNEATLRALAVDSRPMEVEALGTRWNQYIKISPDARINLARTWYAMGKYVPAILELKKAWRDREPGTEELLLSGQAYLAQRLVPEAEHQVRKALALDKTHEEACAELGGILYLQNRFVELDDLVSSAPQATVRASPFLSNLEGHLLKWKGNHAGAADAYRRAAELLPEQGLFRLHEGNEAFAFGDTPRAVGAWLEAANKFLAEEAYDDLAGLVERLEASAPDDARVAGLAGKYFYAIGDETEAETQLARAIGLETSDSAVWYLSGLIASEKKETERAIDSFKKAAELEPTFAPYKFRLAESLFLAGLPCDDELAEALDAGPDDGWTRNLAAMKALQDGDLDGAEANADRARALLPNERAVLVNRAEIARRRGKLDEFLPSLDGDDPESLRAGANLLVEDGRSEEAEEWYVKALRRRPFDPELLMDRAANCLELDMLNEADDLLARAIDLSPSPRAYRLIAYLGGRKGEYARAEVSLIKGLEDFPGDPDILADLTAHYLRTNKSKKAVDVLNKLQTIERSSRVDELTRDVENSSTNKIPCAACGRTWRVPKDIPAQGSLRIADQPPDDLPAGTCPTCGKTFCISCAKKTLSDDGRFHCATCGAALKLIDPNVIWLLNRWQETR